MPSPEGSRESRTAEGRPQRALRKEAEDLSHQLKIRSHPLLDDLLDLASYVAYAEKLLANGSVNRYLRKNHTTTLNEMKELIARILQSVGDGEEAIMTVWSIARAKKELAELVEQAKSNGPQLIRVHRHPVVVVVSIRRWNAMIRRHPDLEKFFWQKTILSPSKMRRAAGTAQSKVRA